MMRRIFNFINFLLILLIFVFLWNFIISIVLFFIEQDIIDLIFAIVNGLFDYHFLIIRNKIC